MNENAYSTLKSVIEEKGLTALYKRIKTVDVTDERIRRGLALFAANIETDGSVSVADILFAAHNLIGKCRVDESAGNFIFSYDKPTTNKKILKHSVVGLYSLININNGISLEIEAVGGSIYSAELLNYLIIPPNKVKKYTAIAEKEGIALTKVGTVLSNNSIIICSGNSIIESIDKSEIIDEDEGVSISLGSDCFDSYNEGYSMLLSYVLCGKVTGNGVACFSLSGSIENVFARALGFFAASMYSKSIYTKLKFLAEDNTRAVVSRPSVVDGEYFYLLKLRNDVFGLPDMVHFFNLRIYLEEYKKRGIIKNVLPYRENILNTLKRLSNDSLEFDVIENTVEDCFGVVVSVERGESLNGIKLGYFRSV